MATRPPRLDEETDAEMAADAETTRIGVKGFSIYIKKTPDGVAVEVYAKGCEDCEELSSCYAYDLDAESMREEYNEEKDLEVD